jgi:hypothetical protein
MIRLWAVVGSGDRDDGLLDGGGYEGFGVTLECD